MTLYVAAVLTVHRLEPRVALEFQHEVIGGDRHGGDGGH